MSLQESGEMYLEAIHILSGRGSVVRAIDVGEYMGYSRPSVSRAVGLLKSGGYITIAAGGAITLTESGRAIAEKIYERHRLITQMLVDIGVNETTAAQDACKMEHDISEESFACLKAFYEKAKKHKKSGF